MPMDHGGTHVTELRYGHELRPVIHTGAAAMDRLFALEDTGTNDAWALSSRWGEFLQKQNTPADRVRAGQRGCGSGGPNRT